MTAPAVATVAAFDFDGTLTSGGSVWPFLLAIVGRRRLALAGLALAGRLALAALLGGRYADEAKEGLFCRTLGGLAAGDIAARAADFGRAHYRRRARPDVRERLEWHRARGHRLLIVSASPEIYLASVAADLGVDAVLATRLAVGGDGRLTGGYEGRNCRGAEKLRRVRQWLDTHPADSADPGDRADSAGPADSADSSGPAPVLWAYGNSAGDRLLLAGADIGVDVGRLGRVGALRSFRRLSELAPDDGPVAG